MTRISDGTNDFDAIRPDETDLFQYDFTDELGPNTTISSTSWQCTVSADSPVADATPQNHIVGTPAFSDTLSLAVIGNMIDGVIYTLISTVQTSDNRTLVKSADVQCVLVVSAESTILTPEQFRAEFPTFKSGDYTNEQIAFWIDTAVNNQVIDATRWGQFYDLGLRLWVAHNILLQKDTEKRGRLGRVPLASGILTNKSIGPASLGYDVRVAYNEDAGHYNLTTFGQQFWHYAQMAGAGPVQISGCTGPDWWWLG